MLSNATDGFVLANITWHCIVGSRPPQSPTKHASVIFGPVPGPLSGESEPRPKKLIVEGEKKEKAFALETSRKLKYDLMVSC